VHEDLVADLLAEKGIDLVASLPCDRAGDLCFLLSERFPTVGLMREEDGVGVSAGAVLAGKRPVVVIQSSGLGNMLNAILSLTVTFGLPLPILASWRGVYMEKIPAQIPFNTRLPAILGAAGIPYTVVEDAGEIGKIGAVIDDAFLHSRPHVALISPKVWEGGKCEVCRDLPPRPCRHRVVVGGRPLPAPVTERLGAIRAVVPHLRDAAVVCNIGVPSKELYAAGDRPLTFYMLGSYTQASAIGLGLALSTERRVIVIDGDGSLLGSSILPVIAASAPKNLTVVCLDNGTFGSTGNQPTCACTGADLEVAAVAAGFRRTCTVADEGEIAAALDDPSPGPAFVRVLIRPGNADVPNIPLSPAEIRDRFMAAVKGWE